MRTSFHLIKSVINVWVKDKCKKLNNTKSPTKVINWWFAFKKSQPSKHLINIESTLKQPSIIVSALIHLVSMFDSYDRTAMLALLHVLAWFVWYWYLEQTLIVIFSVLIVVNPSCYLFTNNSSMKWEKSNVSTLWSISFQSILNGKKDHINMVCSIGALVGLLTLDISWHLFQSLHPIMFPFTFAEIMFQW